MAGRFFRTTAGPVPRGASRWSSLLRCGGLPVLRLIPWTASANALREPMLPPMTTAVFGYTPQGYWSFTYAGFCRRHTAVKRRTCCVLELCGRWVPY
jgi:hypothetical protein